MDPNITLLPLDDGRFVAVNTRESERVVVLNARAADMVRAGLVIEGSTACEVLQLFGLLPGGDHFVVAPVPTLTAWLTLTTRCPLLCDGCYIVSKANDGSAVMSRDTLKEVIDTLVTTAVQHKYDRLLVKYAGGEALTEMGLIEYAHYYLLERLAGLDITLSEVVLTSGVPLVPKLYDPLNTPKRVATLKKLGVNVTVSLDSPVGSHRQRPLVNGNTSWHHAMEAIRELIRAGIMPSVNFVLNKQNIHIHEGLIEDIYQVIKNEISLSVSFYRPNALSSASGADARLRFTNQEIVEWYQELSDFLLKDEKFGGEPRLPRYSIYRSLFEKAGPESGGYACGAGSSQIVFDPNGGMQACQMKIGQPPVARLGARDPLRVLRQVDFAPVDVSNRRVCGTCRINRWCGAGCPVVTYQQTGCNDGPSPLCEAYLQIADIVVRLEAARLVRYAAPIDIGDGAFIWYQDAKEAAPVYKECKDCGRVGDPEPILGQVEKIVNRRPLCPVG
ncbi:MAG TPA: radical SAM protein [Candidatus Acidoferrum sp.]|nr:radical SAM protein [Candidatus Acidoferrum sp.]